MLAKAQSATECRHTCTHRNKCHPNVHITLPATRTHTFYSSVLPARELPAVGDLWENRTPPVPLSSPHAPREGLCPTGATSIYSLIPGLIGACLLFFFFCSPLRLCCSFPSLLLCVWSRSTRFCAITSRIVQPESILHMVPKMEAVIRHDGVSLWGKGRQFCQMMFVLLADGNLASASAICVCETGYEVSLSQSLCLYWLSCSPLCSACPLVLLLLRWEFGCRLIEGRLTSDTSHC